VDAGDHIIEFREKVVRKVEGAIPQDIDFTACEDAEILSIGFVERADFRDLRAQAVFVEPVGLEGSLAVIGDAEVLESEFARGFCHFREAGVTVAGGGVIVEGSAEVLDGDEAGQRACLRSFDFPHAFADFRRHEVEAEGAVDIFFVVDASGFRGAFTAVGSEVVFVEGPAHAQGAAAELNVVFLAAREVDEGIRKLCSADHPEVALQSVGQPDAAFGVATGNDLTHERSRGEDRHESGGMAAGRQKIEIVDGFLAAAERAGDFCARGFRDGAEEFEDFVGSLGGLVAAEVSGVLFIEGDAFENLRHGLFSESAEGGG